MKLVVIYIILGTHCLLILADTKKSKGLTKTQLMINEIVKQILSTCSINVTEYENKFHFINCQKNHFLLSQKNSAQANDCTVLLILFNLQFELKFPILSEDFEKIIPILVSTSIMCVSSNQWALDRNVTRASVISLIVAMVKCRKWLHASVKQTNMNQGV